MPEAVLAPSADRSSVDRPIAVRSSPIHGRGVFATVGIESGTPVIEVRGRVLTWELAQEQHDVDGVAGLTYFFDLRDGMVLDGSIDGNDSQYLNHSCEPNCEAIDHDGRILIHTTRAVAAGAELLLDYQLEVDDDSADDLDSYRCDCGAPTCRRTMLAGCGD